MASTIMPFEGTEWQATEHAGPNGSLVTVPDGIAATATFAGGRVAGSAGCNRYHGSYTADGPAISVGPVATTLMACDEVRMAVEGAFTAAMAGAASWATEDDVLRLFGTDGRVLLRFRAAPSLPLVGTPWRASMVNNGRGSVVSVLEGVEVTALFGEDGRVSGSGGCNRFHGSFALDGAALTIGAIAATRMACASPDGILQQESAFFAALSRVANWTVRDGRLQLRDADGALQADFRPAAEAPA